jgi:hypothetical protein
LALVEKSPDLIIGQEKQKRPGEFSEAQGFLEDICQAA